MTRHLSGTLGQTGESAWDGIGRDGIGPNYGSPSKAKSRSCIYLFYSSEENACLRDAVPDLRFSVILDFKQVRFSGIPEFKQVL